MEVNRKLIAVTIPVVLVMLVVTAKELAAGLTLDELSQDSTLQRGLPGFVVALDKQYEDLHFDRSANGWNQLLDETRSRDGAHFDVRARDRLMTELVSLMNDAGPLRRHFRVLIVESLHRSGQTNKPAYDRAAVFAYDGPPAALPRDLEKLGIHPVKAAAFDRFVRPLHLLMKVGGSNNGVRGGFHGPESLVINYFEQDSWQTETWCWTTAAAYFDDAIFRDAVDAPLRAQLHIIVAVQPYGSHQGEFGPPVYHSLADDLPKSK